MTDHHNYQRLTDRKSTSRIFLFVRRFYCVIRRIAKKTQGVVRPYKALLIAVRCRKMLLESNSRRKVILSVNRCRNKQLIKYELPILTTDRICV